MNPCAPAYLIPSVVEIDHCSRTILPNLEGHFISVGWQDTTALEEDAFDDEYTYIEL